MNKQDEKAVFVFLTHVLLRKIGKGYPDFFLRWVSDLTDSAQQRRVMQLRYTGDSPMKFESIALEMGISPRRVFEHHKNVVNRIIAP